MVKHIVFFKTREGASATELAKMVADFRKFGSSAGYIRNFSIGHDISHRGAFDMALSCELETEADVQRYGADPEHRRIVSDFVAKLCEDHREVVDYVY